jgi:hypothetical protein
LGGAGFASQRTTGEDRSWDLSKYAGIQIAVAKGDSMSIESLFKCLAAMSLTDFNQQRSDTRSL